MSRHDIILIAAEPWEGAVWRRRHHVAWNLAKDNRVLFIEPPTPKAREMVSVKHCGRNLYSVSIKKKFPDSVARDKINIAFVNEILIRRRLKKLTKKMKIGSPLLWVYFSLQQYDYFNLFNEKLIISDWYDMFTTYCGWTSNEYKKEILIQTEKIIKRADIIFAVSKVIHEYLIKRRDGIYFIPHGADQEIFDDRGEDAPEIIKLKSIPGPRIGYLGTIQYKLDFKLLNYLAKKCKDWKIVLAGKDTITNIEDRKDFMRLLSNNNVIYLKEIMREQVPNYLEALDVCIIPFKKIEWIFASAPLKLWEYMASGKSIVAMDRGIEYDCDNYIKTARSSDEFIELIEIVLRNEKSQSAIEERKNIARANSWDKRVEQMMEIIEEKLQKQ